jgi:hypothetical protein
VNGVRIVQREATERLVYSISVSRSTGEPNGDDCPVEKLSTKAENTTVGRGAASVDVVDRAYAGGKGRRRKPNASDVERVEWNLERRALVRRQSDIAIGGLLDAQIRVNRIPVRHADDRGVGSGHENAGGLECCNRVTRIRCKLATRECRLWNCVKPTKKKRVQTVHTSNSPRLRSV